MALIKCPECGKEVSDKATSCPNCGLPFTEKIYCKYCGNLIDAECIVCPGCGKQIAEIFSPTNKPISRAIPLFCGFFCVIFPLIFGWSAYTINPLSAIPSVWAIIIGLTCLIGIDSRRVSKLAAVFCVIGIVSGFAFGIAFVLYDIIFLVIGILEIVYYNKL